VSRPVRGDHVARYASGANHELAAAHARAQRLRFAASPSFAAMLEQAFATRRASA
jgi:hypothetical protein